MSLVFFDMDGTLVNADTNTLFFQHLYEHKIIDDEFLKPMPIFHQTYFEGTLKIEDFILYAIKPIVGMDKAKRDKLIYDCVDSKILPKVKAKALECIKEHQAQHNTLVIVSATVDYIIQAVADRLGINYIIAAPIGVDHEGRIKPEIIGAVPYQDGKKIRIEQFIHKHNFNLDDSYAYGDSLNDLQMLQMVTHGFCVDANDEFKKIPEYNQFEHLTWC